MNTLPTFVNLAALSSRKYLLPLSMHRRIFVANSKSTIPLHQKRKQTPVSPCKKSCISASITTSAENDEKHDKFFQMELRNWEQGFEAYDSGFGPLTRQTIPTLLANAGFPPSDGEDNDSPFCFLDVATGPGFVLSAAAEIASSKNTPFQLTALDFSQNFLDMAKRRTTGQMKILEQQHPNQMKQIHVDFVEGSAEDLPFPDNSFDAITCNFGILHFFKPDTFLRESYRVLRPGGRVSFSAWAPPARTEGFGITLESIAEVGNPNVENLPEGPDFFRFGESREARMTLEGIGFENVDSVELSEMKWGNVADGTMLYDILSNGTVRTKEILLGQSEEESKAVQAMVREKYSSITDGGKRPLRMPAVVSSGQKPVLAE